MSTENEAPSVEQAVEAFAAELAHWRDVRGKSQRKLAGEMGFDPSYVSHIESGRHRPTEGFARRADEVLNTGKAIWRRWQEYDAASRHQALPAREPRREQPAAPGANLLCEHDDAELRYAGGVYHLTMRRRLVNTGAEPITRFLMRISVDRYPGEPERSNRLYRAHPLTWEELGLTAYCRGEEMAWKAEEDRDACKDVWLLFENDDRRFPLYPGEATWIEYAYTVGDDRWGPWFQRTVRLPTAHLSMRLVFPAALDLVMWGTETSMTAESVPLRTAISRRDDAGERVFEWATHDPPLHARYRLEWRFKAGDVDGKHRR